jgi:hypothetical protein
MVYRTISLRGHRDEILDVQTIVRSQLKYLSSMTRQLLCDSRDRFWRARSELLLNDRRASQPSENCAFKSSSSTTKAIREPLAGNQAKVPRASVILLRKHCAAERQDLAVWLALSVPGGSGPARLEHFWRKIGASTAASPWPPAPGVEWRCKT